MLTAAGTPSEKDLSNITVICRAGAVAALLLSGTPLALAQSPAPTLPKGVDLWDLNHDGVYTCAEWKAYLERLFTQADRNHDGRLDAAEFAAMRQKSAALEDADFGYFDENQDGKITHDEFVAKPNEFILRFDRNSDCRVTPDEMKPVQNPNAPVERHLDRFHQN